MGQFFKGLMVFCAVMLTGLNCFAQPGEQNITKGAYVINMGSSPQTVENSLQPYGLIYTLLKNEKIEIKWCINPNKIKDAADFTYRDMTFRGGAFIIPVSYLTDDIRELISAWEEKGIVGMYLEESVNVSVFTSLSVAPRWTLDRENGHIALPFFKAAAIPELI